MVEDEDRVFNYPITEWGVLMDEHGSMDIYPDFMTASSRAIELGKQLVRIDYEYIGRDDD